MSNTAKNLIALCLGIVVALTIAEVLFRYFYPQPMYAIRYSDIGWEHVPGESFWRMGGTREFLTHVSYNSRGMRDREYSVEKPEGTYRILVLGDSYAEGLEVAYEELHTELLEAALNSRAGDCGRFDRFEVLSQVGISIAAGEDEDRPRHGADHHCEDGDRRQQRQPRRHLTPALWRRVCWGVVSHWLVRHLR